jgi:hypothetical protein
VSPAGVVGPFKAPNALELDAGFEGSYGTPPAVVDMAAWVFKVIMKRVNMVQCNQYRDMPAYIMRLFTRIVDDVTFVARAPA